MTGDQNAHHRRSIRLPGYDYAQAGAYFVTLCTQGRECLFGNVVDGVMQLNDAGLVAEKCWLEIPMHFPRVVLDAVIIMPNHVHGILVITDSTVVGANNHSPVGANNHSPVGAKNLSPVGANNHSPLPSPLRSGTSANNHSPVGAENFPPLPSGTSGTIGSVVRGFKIGVTKWMRQNTPYFDVWQRNYYEHIIRNEESLRRIREYIVNSPLQWMLDRETPDVAASTGRGETYFAPRSIPTNTCDHTDVAASGGRGEKYFAPTSIPTNTCDHTNAPTCGGTNAPTCDHTDVAASMGRGEKYFAPTCDHTNAPTCDHTKDKP